MNNTRSAHVGFSLALASMAALAACGERLPPASSPCDNRKPCQSGQICDPVLKRCVTTDARVNVDTLSDDLAGRLDGSAPDTNVDLSTLEAGVFPDSGQVDAISITADAGLPADATPLPKDSLVTKDKGSTPDLQQCASGACCDVNRGAFMPPSKTCRTRIEFRCSSTACGAKAQRRIISTSCSGSSARCDGVTDNPAWTVVATCSPSALCRTDTRTYASCSTCSQGCAGTSCKQCSTGACCNSVTGTFLPATTSCGTHTEYRCAGTGCGADAQTRTVKQLCSGDSADCSGNLTNPAWTSTSCSNSAICLTNNTTFAKCGAKCADGCTGPDCVPTSKVIHLFATPESYKPDFGGRAGGDAICVASHKKSFASLSCNAVRAFISVSAKDEVRDMPALYGVPTTYPIHLSDGKRIAKDWADMLDGSIENPLSSITSGRYITGTSGGPPSPKPGGAVVQTCKGWTVADKTDGGTTGNSTAVDENWLWQGGWRCDLMEHSLLCICWNKP